MSEAPKDPVYVPTDLAARLGVTKKLPIRFATPLEDAAQLPKHEAVMYNNAPLDKVSGVLDDKPKNFDQKVYMFPESYNELRRELATHWPILFSRVGWPMAYDAPTFIEMMDAALNTKTSFDSEKVDGTCKKYIDLLRNLRGLSSLHLPSEKA